MFLTVGKSEDNSIGLGPTVSLNNCANIGKPLGSVLQLLCQQNSEAAEPSSWCYMKI